MLMKRGFDFCSFCLSTLCPSVYLSAVYGVIRTRGNFGAVNVSWVVSPDFTQDVFPVQGTVCFGDQESFKNITVYSLADEVSAVFTVFCLAPNHAVLVLSARFIFCGADLCHASSLHLQLILPFR